MEIDTDSIKYSTSNILVRLLKDLAAKGGLEADTDTVKMYFHFINIFELHLVAHDFVFKTL